jgi:hypothetical protein
MIVSTVKTLKCRGALRLAGHFDARERLNVVNAVTL